MRSISGQLPQTPAGRREQKSLETLAFPFPPRSLSLGFFLFSPLLAAVLFGDQTTWHQSHWPPCSLITHYWGFSAVMHCWIARAREKSRRKTGRRAGGDFRDAPALGKCSAATRYYIICHIWCFIIQLRIWLLGGGGPFAFVRLNSTDQCVKLHDFLSANNVGWVKIGAQRIAKQVAARIRKETTSDFIWKNNWQWRWFYLNC